MLDLSVGVDNSVVQVYLPAVSILVNDRPSDKRSPTGECLVLIVDDNEDAANLLSLLLADRGHAVRVDHCGMDALHSVEWMRPCIAFLDIGLPDMSGLELARELRSRFGRTIALVALTGYGRECDRAASQDAGFDAHLVKPAPMRLILETMTKICN